MFSLFQAKNPYEQPALEVYKLAMDKALEPVFYERYQVADSFTGRFDCLLLHVFMVMERVIEDEGSYKAFNQALFDITFANMDQSLREMGIGDMGVPKHQRKMMKAFNGRMHAYQSALEQGTLKEALQTNLYGGNEDIKASVLKDMEAYVLKSLKHLQKQNVDDIVQGQVSFLGN